MRVNAAVAVGDIVVIVDTICVIAMDYPAAILTSSIVIVIAAPAERYAVRTGIIIAPYSTAAVLAFDGFLKIASVA